MNKLNLLSLFIVLLFSIYNINAQNLFSEVGLGIGNVLGEEHRKGKGEIYINILKSYEFGEVGLDFSTGGNFIPGSSNKIESNAEIVSPNDVKYNSIVAFYRLPIVKKIYFEPRFGYSSLFYWIHDDNKRKINKSNVTYGLGIGVTLLDNLSISLRYQHFGDTPEYEGSKDSRRIISESKPVKLMFIRVAYRFNWDTIF